MGKFSLKIILCGLFRRATELLRAIGLLRATKNKKKVFQVDRKFCKKLGLKILYLRLSRARRSIARLKRKMVTTPARIKKRQRREAEVLRLRRFIDIHEKGVLNRKPRN